ncbi:hypothetical protein A0H81_09171 [Grifola frondosa]|uniref:Uncharacterized protein n=1 Tax=Grifola frondosa TaxID=5627 RepID=A0A1C7M128_GRIFR|nr:hypothetical protein A0H81_09171 [Grifola frondosa]
MDQPLGGDADPDCNPTYATPWQTTPHTHPYFLQQPPQIMFAPPQMGVMQGQYTWPPMMGPGNVPSASVMSNAGYLHSGLPPNMLGIAQPAAPSSFRFGTVATTSGSQFGPPTDMHTELPSPSSAPVSPLNAFPGLQQLPSLMMLQGAWGPQPSLHTLGISATHSVQATAADSPSPITSSSLSMQSESMPPPMNPVISGTSGPIPLPELPPLPPLPPLLPLPAVDGPLAIFFSAMQSLYAWAGAINERFESDMIGRTIALEVCTQIQAKCDIMHQEITSVLECLGGSSAGKKHKTSAESLMKMHPAVKICLTLLNMAFSLNETQSQCHKMFWKLVGVPKGEYDILIKIQLPSPGVLYMTNETTGSTRWYPSLLKPVDDPANGQFIEAIAKQIQDHDSAHIAEHKELLVPDESHDCVMVLEPLAKGYLVSVSAHVKKLLTEEGRVKLMNKTDGAHRRFLALEGAFMVRGHAWCHKLYVQILWHLDHIAELFPVTSGAKCDEDTIQFIPSSNGSDNEEPAKKKRKTSSRTVIKKTFQASAKHDNLCAPNSAKVAHHIQPCQSMVKTSWMHTEKVLGLKMWPDEPWLAGLADKLDKSTFLMSCQKELLSELANDTKYDADDENLADGKRAGEGHASKKCADGEHADGKHADGDGECAGEQHAGEEHAGEEHMGGENDIA